MGLGLPIWVALWAGGCGEDSPHRDPVVLDAGSEDAAPDGAVEDAGPEGPAPVALPVLTPCPTGWEEVEDPSVPGLVTCDPWPDGADDCAEDEAHFPGSARCERIGPVCPVGDFADDLPEGADVLYVKAGAAAGGDGSLALPFDRIAQALARPSVDVIALSKGTFAEDLEVRREAVLWGACVRETILQPSGPRDGWPTIWFDGSADAGLRSLQVTGPRRGVDVGGSGLVTLEDVLVHDTPDTGIFVYGSGGALATNVVVRGTVLDFDGDGGNCLEIGDGATVTSARIALERCEFSGATVWGGAVLLGEDMVVRSVVGTSDVVSGYGVAVFDGASATLTRTVVEEARLAGISTSDTGASIEGSDLVVRATQPRLRDDAGGYGALAYLGGRLDLTRSSFIGNRGLGLAVRDEMSTLSAEDVVILDTLEEVNGGFGYGIQIGIQASAVLTRVASIRDRSLGIHMGVGNLEASDLTVRDPVADDDGDAYCLQAHGATQITRMDCAGAAGAGIFANSGSPLVLDDLVVDGVSEDSGGAGCGIVTVGSAVDVERFRISGSAVCGAAISDQGTIDLHHGEVSDNPVGVGLPSGYDRSRLQDDVDYLDNGVDFLEGPMPLPPARDDF